MSKKILLATVALIGSLAVSNQSVLAANAAATAPTPAASTPAVPAGDPVVARVNGEEIHRSDVLHELQMAGPQMQQMPPQMLYPQILQKLIATKVVSQKGYADNLQNDKDVKARVKSLQDEVVAEAYIHKAIDPKITDAKIKERYDQLASKFKSQDEIRARHILITVTVPANASAADKAKADADAKAQAEDIIKQLKAGADFAKLAEDKSKDTSSAKQGGDLGYFVHDAMVKPFADAAFAMKVGDISDTPVKSDFGYHIIKIEDKRKSSPPPIAEVKDQISGQLGQEMASDEVKSLEAKAKIEKFDINGQPIKDEAPAK